MNKLALNIICKDEAHVILRMLNTIKGIADLIVVTDTGSTDGTQDVIKRFGSECGIPTYVFERPFDNFENSRNHAMDKLKEVATELQWDHNTTYGFWVDCDEVLEVDSNFNKRNLSKDLYMFNTRIGAMKYTRNEMWRISKKFRWWGPCHEFIVCDENVTSDIAQGLSVNVFMDGGSWKSDVSEKYKKHSQLLEHYIDYKDRSSRWVFYTAQSYHDSATTKNKDENAERARRAIKYYRERISRNDGYEEERYYSQLRIGTLSKNIEEPWSTTQMELLKAYSMDPLRGESIKVIIDHYQQMGEWALSYMYSKFAKVNFHNSNPYPKRLLFIDESLYAWRFLEIHATSCYYTGRKHEAKETFAELTNIISNRPELFTDNDKQRIMNNANFFNSLA